MTMKTMTLATCVAAVFLATVASSTTGLAESPEAGGYRKASVSDKEVVAAASFAIKAQQQTMQDKQQPAPPKLELVKILRAEQQVVAGINYRLRMRVRLNGKEKTAETVVWWQSWRKPDPYQLTSWTWK